MNRHDIAPHLWDWTIDDTFAISARHIVRLALTDIERDLLMATLNRASAVGGPVADLHAEVAAQLAHPCNRRTTT